MRGRLWRASNPSIDPDRRQTLVNELMTARRAVGVARKTGDSAGESAARATVDRVKQALGERGPIWWSDGAPDYNRHMIANTPYADWFADLHHG